jgi:phosphoglycerate dehydrogenase-like enzyme
MNCIFLDSIAPEMKQVLLSQKPDDIHVLFWDELAEKDKAEKLAATDALLTATYKVDDTMLRQAPKVKIVQKLGVGTDNIDSTAAAKYGIKVGNVPGGNANGVAEMTIGLILDLYHKISLLDRETRAGDWSMWKYRNCSYEMKNKVHGIVGFGNIGKRVAELSKAFGANLLYYSRTKATAETEKQYGVTYMELDELLQTADIVSIHLPLNPETRNLFNAEKLALMKPTAVLVNVGRGNVVNEQDLYQALIEGKLSGAAIDVWASEPIPPNNPLLSLDNVVVTPHVGGGTVDAAINNFQTSFQKIRETLRGNG